MADNFSLGSYRHWDCICNCAHLLGHVWDCKVSVYLMVSRVERACVWLYLGEGSSGIVLILLLW